MRLVHWQDLGSSVVGIWLCVSPFFLGLSGVGAWATVIFGLLVVLFAIEGLIMPSYLEELFEAVLGIALVAAPWSIGYDSTIATYDSVISGALVLAFAVSEMLTDREFLTWLRGRGPRISA
jgi:SPW repeat-containing protein